MATDHTFEITVSGCSADQASTVIAERINYDEDYGFPYGISWEPAAAAPVEVFWPENPTSDVDDDTLVNIVTLQGEEFDGVDALDVEQLAAHLSQWDYGDENDGAASVNGYDTIPHVERDGGTKVVHGGLLYWVIFDQASGVAALYRRPLDAGKPAEEIVISRDQLTQWLGRRPTHTEIARLAAAIPNSSIPEAVGTIVDGFD